MQETIVINNDYHLYKEIGKGSFGKVYLTLKESSPDRLFATKRINLSIVQNKKSSEYFENEIKIMKNLNHPNIIKLYDFNKSKNFLYLIIDYCNGGNINNLLKKYKKKYSKPFPIKIIQYFMKQIVEGLKYIHSKNIIHRDIKLSNILINLNKSVAINKKDIDINDLKESDLLSSQIKIIDFGLSTILGPSRLAKTFAGTIQNMDPIIIEKYNKAGGFEKLEGYDEKADIWSLGTICYEMLTGEQLFNVRTVQEILNRIEKGNYSLPYNIELTEEIISFLNSMLQYNPSQRSSAEQLSQHPFLKKDVKNFIKYHNESNEINTSYLLTCTLADSTIKNIVNVKDENKKRVLNEYINCLLNDYGEAKAYFNQINSPKQEQDAFNKCKLIKDIKNKMELEKKIDINNLPKPINPEYIYDCSTNERNKKFRDILNIYRAEKNDLEVKIKIFENQVMNKSTKEEYESYEINKINFDDLNKLISKIEKFSKNVWIPVPNYIKETKIIQCKKINYDGCQFQIKMKINKIDNIKEKIILVITFIVNESKELKEEIELNLEKINPKEWIWNLSKDEWMNIDNNIDNFILRIDLSKNNWSKGLENKNIYIDISKIKNGKAISLNQPLPNGNEEKIEFSIIPIFPKGKQYESKVKKEKIKINDFYPPFHLKSNVPNLPLFNVTFKNK